MSFGTDYSSLPAASTNSAVVTRQTLNARAADSSSGQSNPFGSVTNSSSDNRLLSKPLKQL